MPLDVMLCYVYSFTGMVQTMMPCEWPGGRKAVGSWALGEATELRLGICSYQTGGAGFPPPHSRWLEKSGKPGSIEVTVRTT